MPAPAFPTRIPARCVRVCTLTTFYFAQSFSQMNDQILVHRERRVAHHPRAVVQAHRSHQTQGQRTSVWIALLVLQAQRHWRRQLSSSPSADRPPSQDEEARGLVLDQDFFSAAPRAARGARKGSMKDQGQGKEEGYGLASQVMGASTSAVAAEVVAAAGTLGAPSFGGL
ncbi:hypothetical protein B0H63DRAFT_464619 [Podospora didyma]|uniref:Uncharacterized protein n=1 Tax=Podospora didyma TaxID=330526 RepID=A0AAE0NY91_9PEZI|nr:hypothetical protein B0H63DRAFT_464619 [Podospora didyma]